MLNQIREWIKPTVEIESRQKVKVIPIADLHTGGSTALFPFYNGDDLGYPPHKNMTGNNGAWEFKHTTYLPTAKQYQLFRQFTKCAEEIAKEREQYKYVVVATGDGVEGQHHDTLQLATKNIGEQVDVHVWLMKYFLSKIGFERERGDKLFVGAGTECHDGDEDFTIADRLEADRLPNGDNSFDFMPMDINDKRFWFLHHGASAGRDMALGNALHNWMRNKYWMCLEEGRVIPNCVISGHYHKNVYDTFTRNDKTMHGIILPPFQLKTRFGYRVAAAELEGVGIRTIDVDGDVKVNPAMLLGSHDDVVTV
jgi:hypothetical protein